MEKEMMMWGGKKREGDRETERERGREDRKQRKQRRERDPKHSCSCANES